MLKLDEEVKVLENLVSGHSSKKCGFLPGKDICNTFKNLPALENYLQEDTKMALIYIGSYICCKDERIDGTFFIMRNMVVF